MTKIFTYSILQYKHSLLSRESINVGLLFFFFEEKKMEFVYDNTNRLKTIYDDFDSSTYYDIINYVDQKSKRNYSNLLLFNNFPDPAEIKGFIDTEILTEDSSSLQFTEPLNSVQITDNTKKIILDFTALFLPFLLNQKEEVPKKDEIYLARKFNAILHSKDKGIDNKIARNQTVIANKTELKFEYSWQNEVTHLVKAVSFDLQEKRSIQVKTALYRGYFSLLGEFARVHKKTFDILTTAPQDESLTEYYLDAIELLEKSPAPVKIIAETVLDKYASDTLVAIDKHLGV